LPRLIRKPSSYPRTHSLAYLPSDHPAYHGSWRMGVCIWYQSMHPLRLPCPVPHTARRLPSTDCSPSQLLAHSFTPNRPSPPLPAPIAISVRPQWQLPTYLPFLSLFLTPYTHAGVTSAPNPHSPPTSPLWTTQPHWLASCNPSAPSLVTVPGTRDAGASPSLYDRCVCAPRRARPTPAPLAPASLTPSRGVASPHFAPYTTRTFRCQCPLDGSDPLPGDGER